MSVRKKPKGGTRKRPSSNPDDAGPFSPLYAAYADWLQTRAELVRGDGSMTDKQMGNAIDNMARADWRMLQTPAQCFADIRVRAQTVQFMFSEAMAAGEPTDNRHHAALAVLINEILEHVLESTKPVT